MKENNKENQKIKNKKFDKNVIKIAIILVIGSMAPLLDSTMANVAVKTMVGYFHSTVSIIQWVITGYVLAMAVAVPFSGWAINRLGGKKLYMFSLILFFIGSILSSLSWNIGSLIAFRVIQGFAAGLLIPTTSTIVVQSAKGQNLGELMSIISVPAVIGPILGPVLGGIIVGTLNWRWIFYINIPICIVALLLAWRMMPNNTYSENKQPLDIIGIILLSSTFSILIYEISQISSLGIKNRMVFIPLIIGLILMITFILYALHKKTSPVLDLHLFKSKNFSISNILLFLSGIITNGAMLILPLYYQQVRGDSIVIAGVLLIPQGVGMLLTRSWVGKLFDSIGPRLVIIVSILITILGTLPFAFANAYTNNIILMIALLLRGAGLGGLLIPIMSSAYIGLDKKQIPDASIATRIFQTIGGAFGSVILATVIQHQLLYNSLHNIQSTSGAYNIAFLWSIGFAVIAIVPALLIPTHKNKIANT